MTRPSRIEYPGAIDQGMPRSSLTRSVFEDDCDWRRLLEGLEQTVGRLGGDLLSFVLLPNNFHLSLRAPQPTKEWAIHRLFDFLARQVGTGNGDVDSK